MNGVPMGFDQLLTYLLALQIVLAFFAPPFPVGERLVFPADLWAFAWVPIAWFRVYLQETPSGKKQILRTTLLFAALFLIIYLHGATRVPFAEEFGKFIAVSRDDSFNSLKEAVVAFRFFIWCVGALIVFRARPNILIINRLLAVCVSLIAITMLASYLIPEVRSLLGTIYHYNPDAQPWPERIYGPFSSPIEGCLALCLSFLLLIEGKWASPKVKYGVLAGILLGIFLTKTLTGVIAVVVALVYALSTRVPKKYLLSFGVAAFVGLGTLVAMTWNTPFATFKRGNLVFRLKPWGMYWDILTSRVDYFLLGMGFHPHFTDNIYLFYFSRGGLLLLLTSISVMALAWIRSKNAEMPWQRAILVFFIVAGLTVDVTIVRPIVYLLITVAIAEFSKKKNSVLG